MIDIGPSLLEAAPYIARFRGEHVVVKIGGELFAQPATIERLVSQIAVLQRCGLRPVVVHGGGRQIDARCRERGITPRKRGGRRSTSVEVLEVVLEVVAGELNAQLCALLAAEGVPAAGFAAGLSRAIRCQRRPPVTLASGEAFDFGEVGDVVSVDTTLLLGARSGARRPFEARSGARRPFEARSGARHPFEARSGARRPFEAIDPAPAVAVLPCIGETSDGRRLNVNADSVAAHVAIALGAQKLVMASSVAGVLGDHAADGPISQLDLAQLDALLAGEQVAGGMRAKLEEAKVALAGGVSQVHIISGSEPHTLLREIFTAEGCGTLISASRSLHLLD